MVMRYHILQHTKFCFLIFDILMLTNGATTNNC